MSDEPEAPVVPYPPFLANRSSHPEPPVCVARATPARSVGASQRRREREIEILLGIGGVLRTEGEQRHVAVGGTRESSGRNGRVRHHGVPEMKRKDAVLRQGAADREAEGAGEAADGHVSRAAGRRHRHVSETLHPSSARAAMQMTIPPKIPPMMLFMVSLLPGRPR